MEAYAQTDVGRMRPINQDYIFYSIMPVGNLQNLFVVADGMGGHNAGEYASWYTVETLVQLIRESKEQNLYEILAQSIQEVNQRLIRKSYEEDRLRGMGTTLTLATVVDKTLYVVNIGDSRTYLINEQEIRQISQDHSLVEEMVRLGGIKPEEAKHHPDKNIITRAIGAKADVDVDFYEHRLKRGDIILMCTDGLSNMVEDEELFRIIRQDKDIQEIGGELLMKANRNGGLDNIAVVLVEIDNSEVRI